MGCRKCNYLNAHELWRLVAGEETEPVMPMVCTGYLDPLGVNCEGCKDTDDTMDTKVEVGMWKKRSTTMPECPLGVDASYLQRWDRYENIAGLVQDPEFDDLLF